MLSVRIPTNKNFNYYQSKKLYEKNQHLIGDSRDFQTIAKTTFFYSFFNDKNYIGSIYFYYENGKLFVNAYSGRHTHLINIECFKQSLEYFSCDIYAHILHRTSAIGAIKCGFKRLKDNLFIYERK